MPTYAVQRLDGTEIATTPITREAYDAALALAKERPDLPKAVEEAVARQADLTLRILADIPPFVGPDGEVITLKAGDVAAVAPGIAGILLRRQKAALVEAAAC